MFSSSENVRLLAKDMPVESAGNKENKVFGCTATGPEQEETNKAQTLRSKKVQIPINRERGQAINKKIALNTISYLVSSWTSLTFSGNQILISPFPRLAQA